MLGGTQQISEGMARLLGDAVHLNRAVISVTETDSGVIVTDCNNTKYRVSFYNKHYSDGYLGAH